MMRTRSALEQIFQKCCPKAVEFPSTVCEECRDSIFRQRVNEDSSLREICLIASQQFIVHRIFLFCFVFFSCLKLNCCAFYFYPFSSFMNSPSAHRASLGMDTCCYRNGHHHHFTIIIIIIMPAPCHRDHHVCHLCGR